MELQPVKYIVLLGDGMADWPLEAYDNRTPLEVAKTPAMDRAAALGTLGQFCPIPEGFAPGSDIGNLSCFGYNPKETFSGRAPMEAANQKIALAQDEVAFRCNLVNVQSETMHDFTAGHISTAEAAELIDGLNKTLANEFPVKFHPGVSYRHLAIVPGSDAAALEDLVTMQCEPPHNITDQGIDPYLPKGKGDTLIRAMMRRSRDILAKHPLNAARIARGELPATQIWLWGQGKAPIMKTYGELYGLSGAVISAVDLVNGIGVLAGLEVISVPGATGWIDTNYEGKIQQGLAALDRHDFVYIHLEAPDETAHQGRADLKIQAIEDFDARIVAPALAYLEQHPDTRILVCPDHFTTIKTKTHAGGPVPFVLCGAGVAHNGHAAYSEAEAAKTGLCVTEGYTLTRRMLQSGGAVEFPELAVHA